MVVVQLPEGTIDVSHQIAKSCETTAEQNSFAVIGRAGLPSDPQQLLQARLIWQDQRIWTGEQVRVPTIPGAGGKIRQGRMQQT